MIRKNLDSNSDNSSEKIINDDNTKLNRILATEEVEEELYNKFKHVTENHIILRWKYIIENEPTELAELYVDILEDEPVKKALRNANKNNSQVKSDIIEWIKDFKNNYNNELKDLYDYYKCNNFDDPNELDIFLGKDTNDSFKKLVDSLDSENKLKSFYQGRILGKLFSFYGK